MTFTEFIDFVLVRLYELGTDEGGRLHDVQSIAAELREPVPTDWAWEATKTLGDSNLVMAALAMGHAASATITGEGRLYVETHGLVDRYRDRAEGNVTVQGEEHPRFVSEASHEWALQNRRFLGLVFEAFDREGDWPELSVMQRRLIQAGDETDVTTPALALPTQEIGYREAPLPGRQERFVLTLPGLRYVSVASALLDDFMRVFRLAVVRYRSPGEPLTVKRADLTDVLGLSEEQTTKLSRILVRGTAFLGGGPSDIASWELGIHESVLVPLLNATTIDEYLAGTSSQRVQAQSQMRAAVNPGAEFGGADASKPVFLVHGHDRAVKHEVARFLDKVTTPGVTILDEQPGKGRTLIEKFEDHAATAGYAVVLLTGDDEGRERGKGEWLPRARQNVILELGFFVAKLGRGNVAMLYQPDVERPSDIDGVSYISLDPGDGWKTRLAREMKAAGVAIDSEKALEA